MEPGYFGVSSLCWRSREAGLSSSDQHSKTHSSDFQTTLKPTQVIWSAAQVGLRTFHRKKSLLEPKSSLVLLVLQLFDLQTDLTTSALKCVCQDDQFAPFGQANSGQGTPLSDAPIHSTAMCQQSTTVGPPPLCSHVNMCVR